MTTPQELSFPGMCSWWANAKTVKEEEQVQHFVRVFVAEMVGQVGRPSRSSCCTTPCYTRPCYTTPCYTTPCYTTAGAPAVQLPRRGGTSCSPAVRSATRIHSNCLFESKANVGFLRLRSSQCCLTPKVLGVTTGVLRPCERGLFGEKAALSKGIPTLVSSLLSATAEKPKSCRASKLFCMGTFLGRSRWQAFITAQGHVADFQLPSRKDPGFFEMVGAAIFLSEVFGESAQMWVTVFQMWVTVTVFQVEQTKI